MSVRPSVAGSTASDTGLDRHTWIVAGVVIVGIVMSVIDTTIVNVALDTLGRELHSPFATIQWVSTGYLLSLAMVIPLSGWMSERFGSKRVWMVSVAVFGLGSALCGLAWSAGSLIFFRILQGFGGGMIQPVALSVLAQTAGPARVGRVISVVGAPILLGPILGPVIGGLIVDNTSWRWIFYVNVPIAALALLLAARFLSPDSGRADAGRLDWLGLSLLSPGLAGIVFGLSETESHGGIGHPIAFGPIVAGLILVALFVLHSLRAVRPLIDIGLFRKLRFSAAAASVFLIGAALFGSLLILPLYYQVARGQTALTAGLLIAPQGIGAALAIPFAGRLVDRVGGGRVVLAGSIIMTLATLPLMWVGPGTSYLLLALVLVARGVGMGCSFLPATAAAFAVLRPDEVPRASSALTTLQRIGGSIGTALIAVVLQHQIRAALPAGSGGAGGLLQPLPAGRRGEFAGPIATAFGNTFAWTVALTLLAIVPAALLAASERSARSAERGLQPAVMR
jgi:EmrB/QacA subfamily drug resistance transporter